MTSPVRPVRPKPKGMGPTTPPRNPRDNGVPLGPNDKPLVPKQPLPVPPPRNPRDNGVPLGPNDKPLVPKTATAPTSRVSTSPPSQAGSLGGWARSMVNRQRERVAARSGTQPVGSAQSDAAMSAFDRTWDELESRSRKIGRPERPVDRRESDDEEQEAARIRRIRASRLGR